MQVCALDDNNQIAFAAAAQKQKDYFCLECRQVVRLRSGRHRQPHFFHLQPNNACRLHAKGMPHLMAQHVLLSHLPPQEAVLECRFPKIGRIADVAWHTQKIIFEIQCSPISAKEVAERTASYKQAGYRIVWILHDSRYNRLAMTAAEDALQDIPHYFTNMDSNGTGTFYDQFSIIESGIRITKLPKVNVDLTSPFFNEGKMPPPLASRCERWGLRFSGDTLDRYLSSQNESIVNETKKLIDKHRLSLKQFLFRWFMAFWKKKIVFHYRSLFRLALERACR